MPLSADYQITFPQAEAFFADWHRLSIPVESAAPIDSTALSEFAHAFAAHYPAYCQRGLLVAGGVNP